MNRKPDSQIDVRGAFAPLTLLKITHAFRAMGAGQVLEVRVDDGETRQELNRILARFPHSIDEITEDGSGYRIHLRKN
jgi:TusA-related sulfurtransferase